MDLTRAVGYRGFALNSVAMESGTSNLSGCEIVSVEYGAVNGVGYDEKRALYDGHDASDVFLGKRVVGLAGALYGLNRGKAFEEYLRLSDILTPTDAYEALPANKGFHPLDFYVPTQSAVLRLIMHARPTATPIFRWNSDRSGGEDVKPLAIPWQAQLECIDPRLYSYDLTEHTLSGTSGSFTAQNDGNRPTSLRLTLIAATSGTFVLTISAVNYLSIAIPVGGFTTVYDSAVKVLTYNGALAMNNLTLPVGQHPNFNAGGSSVTWTSTVALTAGSKVEYRSAWA